MSLVKFRKKGNDIISMEIDGHTEFGVEGEDIVCAGLSCVAQTAVLGIFRVAQVNATYQVDEERGYLLLELPENLSEEERKICNIILQTALIGIADLRDGYSDYIELEVKEDYVY